MILPPPNSTNVFRWAASLLRQAKVGLVRVAIVVGGAFKDIVRRPEVAGCHLTVYLDVATEMNSAGPAPGVIQLVLAQGHTIGTLTKVRCPAKLKEFLQHRPGVDLTEGLAQLRAIGKLAIQELLNDPSFADFVRTQVFEPLLILTNGNLAEVELLAYSSGSGGTGGPVTNVFLGAVFAELKKRSQAIVHLRNIRVGSLTYVTLGDRVASNGAATLAEDLYSILVAPRDEHEVRSLSLLELPMVQGNAEARATYATQVVQALDSTQVRTRMGVPAPNRATQTEFGTVTIIHPGFWTAIPPRRIAEDASRDYGPQLERVKLTPARTGQLQQVRPVPRLAPVETAPTTEDLMSEVRGSAGVRPEDFAVRCLAPTEHCTGGSVTITVAGAGSYDVDGDLLAALGHPVASLAEWQEKFATIRTALEGVRREITTREPEVRKWARRLDAARRDLQKAFDLEYPKGLNRFGSFLASPQSKRVRLQNAIVKGRELGLAHLKANSEVELLTNARARLQDVLTGEERRVEGLLSLLRPFQCPSSFNAPRLVETAPLDGILTRLLGLAQHGSRNEEVAQVLATAASRVTLAGLAAITGAPEAQPFSIAQALFGGEPPTLAPRWGGRTSAARGMRLVVLPPVDPTVLEAIQAQAPALDGDTVVLAADTAQGGANVVQLDIHYPRAFNEIITKYLEAALEDACETHELHADEHDESLPAILHRLVPTRMDIAPATHPAVA